MASYINIIYSLILQSFKALPGASSLAFLKIQWLIVIASSTQ